MSTKIRPETVKNNPYWLPKHRFYELKHFCMQYPDWLKSGQNRANIDLVSAVSAETDAVIGPIIFRAIVNDWSYECANAHDRIPCCKDVYYQLYRKFFYILSTRRN